MFETKNQPVTEKDPLVSLRRFESRGDIANALTGSILRYKGGPVYVSQALSDHEITVVNTDNIALNIDVNSVFLDLRKPHVGYVNFRTEHSNISHAVYTGKLAKRQWHRGFYHDPYNSWEYFASIVQCMNGEYPSFDEAFEQLKNCTRVAFDKDFCLEQENGVISLLYKDRLLGYVSSTKEVSLFPQYDNPTFRMPLELKGVKINESRT